MRTIILEADGREQKKILLLRNPTSLGIVVKLETNAPLLSISQKAAVIPAKRQIELIATFPSRSSSLQLTIFARPVHLKSMKKLKEWITAPANCDKSSRMAFQLTAIPSKKLFSAPAIILDLPGEASLIESETRTYFEENDTTETAQQISNKDLLYPVKCQNMAEQYNLCEKVRSFLDTIYPPIVIC